MCVVRLVSAAKRESAGDSCPYTDDALQTFNGEFVDTVQWQTISSSRFFELVSGDLIGLEDAKQFFGGFLNCWVESAHPLLPARGACGLRVQLERRVHRGRRSGRHPCGV